MSRLTRFITPVGMCMTNLNSMKHYMPCVPCRHKAEKKIDANGKGYTEKHSYCDTCEVKMLFNKLKHYEDLEEQGRLIDWKRTSEEKPGSTRHVIVADGAIISHYGYYLKPKDKWFTNWKCEEEISAPMFWMDVPDPPKESLFSECGAKMDEVE